MWTDANGIDRSRYLTAGERVNAYERRMTPHMATCPTWGQDRPARPQPATPPTLFETRGL